MSNKFSDLKLNIENLTVDIDDIYKLPEKREDVRYEKFILNNWKLHDNNNLLNEIDLKGGAVWFDNKGCFIFRRILGGSIVEITSKSQFEGLLKTYLSKYDVLFCRWYKKQPPSVDYPELKMVEDKFTPFSNSEFYIEKGHWYRTSFIPSDYLSNKYNVEVNRFEYIDNLIGNLVDYKEDRKEWVYNWLAGFFQTLTRSRVSLVLRGEQGSGKGIFFTEIISPLFGKDYCVTVSDENLESDFKSWVDEKLFYNLNEVAVDIKSRRNTKNFLKQLVSDETVSIQTKFKDFKSVHLYGNILITSNEAFPIEVEISDRRFTIFQTGKSLKSIGANIEELLLEIKNELSAFANFLKNYNVDWDLYNMALDTPEKNAIIDGTTSTMKRFIYAILTKDKTFFVDLESSDNLNDQAAYNGFFKYIDSNRISINEMYELYKAIFDSNKTLRKFTLELRNLEPEVFHKNNLRKSAGYRYYEIK